MKLINRTLLLTFLFIGAFVLAEIPARPPSPAYGPPGGGGGGVGPGTPASPIDMYVYIFAIVAVVFIAMYAKKILKKQAV